MLGRDEREMGKRGIIIGKWERERKEFLEEREVKMREKGRIPYEELEEGEMRKQRGEKEKIEESNYNKYYKERRGERIPKYLKKGWSGKEVEIDYKI